jgi:hypothetical protein
MNQPEHQRLLVCVLSSDEGRNALHRAIFSIPLSLAIL